MKDRILKILMWVGIILLAPIVFSFWMIFVFIFVIIVCIALIWGLIIYLHGYPIDVVKDGKRVGSIVRGKFRSNK